MPSAKKKKSKKEKVNFKVFYIHYIYCLVIIIFLLIAGININNYLSSKKVLGASIDITPLQNEENYWQNLVSKTPSFTDGYLQLAKISVELGNKNQGEGYIIKALSLDPNNTKVISVQKELGL